MHETQNGRYFQIKKKDIRVKQDGCCQIDYKKSLKDMSHGDIIGIDNFEDIDADEFIRDTHSQVV